MSLTASPIPRSAALSSQLRAVLATKVAAHLVLSTLGDVQGDDLPVAEGVIYAGLMAHGCTLSQFQSLMGSLANLGLISRDSHQVTLLPKGQEAVTRLAAEIATLKAKIANA